MFLLALARARRGAASAVGGRAAAAGTSLPLPAAQERLYVPDRQRRAAPAHARGLANRAPSPRGGLVTTNLCAGLRMPLHMPGGRRGAHGEDGALC